MATDTGTEILDADLWKKLQPETRDLITHLRTAPDEVPCDFAGGGVSCRNYFHGDARAIHRSSDATCSGAVVVVGRFTDPHSAYWEGAACAAHEAWASTHGIFEAAYLRPNADGSWTGVR